MNKTVLLTGSDGFIGSYIADELLNNNYQVIGIDDHSKYKHPSISHHANPNFKGYELDIIDTDDLGNIYHLCEQNIDAIIHCAAKIGGISYFHQYQYDLIRDNAHIDTNIIQCALDNNIKRFIGLSSSMVYENTKDFPSDERDVEHIAPPTSSYGFSKLSMERMIKAAYDQYGLNYTIIRPFNAVGVGENDFLEGKSSHVLPDLIIKCLKIAKNNDANIELLGDGNQTRCFTHAKDIARGIRLALESDKAINETFNIANPTETKIIDLAKKIWDKTQPMWKTFWHKATEPLQYDVQRRVPCIKKAKEILGFEAGISLDDSIDEVIDYIKNKII